MEMHAFVFKVLLTSSGNLAGGRLGRGEPYQPVRACCQCG